MSDGATAPKTDSFVTNSGKVHLMSHKVEATVQVVCVLLSLAGLIMVSFNAHDEHDKARDSGLVGPGYFEDYKSIGYIFASGSFLCIALLFNAAAHLPQLTPLLMGMGFFYFSNSIARVDEWVTAKDDGYDFNDYNTLMAGSIISLIATIIACIFEISLPGSGKGRNSGCGAAEVAAILFMLIGFIGLCVLWNKNDSGDGFNVLTYRELQKLSIEAILSMMFLGDALMHYDSQITSGAILIGTITGCNMFLVGIEYEQIADRSDDQRIARQGALTTAVCIGVLVIVGILVTALGRNNNEEGRRRPGRRETEAEERTGAGV